MSFTLEVKNSLVSTSGMKSCCKRALLAGIISFGGSIKDTKYMFSTENIESAQLVTLLASELFGLHTCVYAKSNIYCVEIDNINSALTSIGMIHSGTAGIHIPPIFDSECCMRAYTRGAFLGGGSVISPEKRYHLEFVTSHFGINREFRDIFRRFDIPAKNLVRKSRYVTYFKDNEIICDVLALIGAGSAVIEISNTNIQKSIKNNDNRRINCETANMDKTIDAAVRQVMAIKKIDDKIGIDSLPDSLAQLAHLRLANKDLSLTEIGQKLNPPISKSGVNHRMRKIMDIAAEVTHIE